MRASTSPKLKLLLVLEQSWTWSNVRDFRQHKCRPMLRLTKRINEAIPCGPCLSHGALVEFFTLSWVVERWNLSSTSLLLSLFFKISHVYCQAKGLSKKRNEVFLNDLKTVFEMVWWRGRKLNHIKRVFEVEVFSSAQNIDFPFYLKRFLELFSLSLFLNTFSSSFSLSFSLCATSWGLGGFDDIRGEKSLLQKFLFK
jgi:hypothetical protein